MFGSIDSSLVTISHCSKFSHPIQVNFHIFIKFIVDLNFLSSKALHFILIFLGHSLMSHNFHPSTFCFFSVDRLASILHEESTLSYAIIISRSSCPTAIIIFSGKVARKFVKLANSIQFYTFSRPSFIHMQVAISLATCSSVYFQCSRFQCEKLLQSQEMLFLLGQSAILIL